MNEADIDGREKFADAHVESGRIFDRDVVLFRARDRKAPAPAKEIEISYEAFEDHTLKDIQDALERQNAAQLLIQHPNRRLFLSRNLMLRASAYDPRRAHSRRASSQRDMTVQHRADREED